MMVSASATYATEYRGSRASAACTRTPSSPVAASLARMACSGAARRGGDGLQIRSVAALPHAPAERQELRAVDPAVVEGDLLDTRDLETLPLLDRLDEMRGIEQRVVRAGVQPRIAAPQHFDAQSAAAQVALVEIGDLQFAARRGAQLLSLIHISE